MTRPLGQLTEPELSRLLSAADTHSRDRALLELIISCGLTSTEAAALTRDDVRGNTLRLRGAKPRTTALTHQAVFHLERYLTARRDSLSWLFVRSDRAVNGSKIRSHLTARSIQRTLEHYSRSAGLTQRITPGVLRRLFAQAANERGQSAGELQTALGHKHSATTERFLRAK